MTFFDELQRATEEERNTLLSAPLIDAAMEGKASLPAYQAFLGEAYHHVKHTVPLLMACGSRLPDSHEWMRQAVADYIAEEIGHHEWILNDIRACGGDAEAVRSGRPRLATELMVAYAYDTVQRRNPIGFFGMVLVLEGTSVRLATRAAEVLGRSLGLPQEAFSYLASHGSLDISHMQYFQSLVNRIADPDEQACIVHCAKVFYRLYGDIFRELEQEAAQWN